VRVRDGFVHFALGGGSVHRRSISALRLSRQRRIQATKAAAPSLPVQTKEMVLKLMGWLTAGAALIAASACEVTVNDNAAAPGENEATAQMSPEERARQAQLAQMREQARQEVRDLRFVVDISDRELRVFQGDRVVRTEPVAVGTSEWPTPTGSWRIHQVDMNPEWIPPDEEWAENRERKAPGAEDNPMGRARLVYRMPNTIHGTNELDSLGRAASHGSIRVANEVVLELAQMILKAGGAWEGDQWFQQMVQNRSREYQIKVPDPVPIEVRD
jgi:lipoprotein-anchoring transpeptidase ErfK/SrfK